MECRVPRIRKNYYFFQCFCLVSFFRVYYAYMRKKMKDAVRYKFNAWFPFSQVCDIASVVSTSVTELTMALVVPALGTVPIKRTMRTRLKDWRTKR